MGYVAIHIVPACHLGTFGPASGVRALLCVADLESRVSVAAAAYPVVAGEVESDAGSQGSAGTEKRATFEAEGYVGAGPSHAHAAAGGGAALEALAVAAGKDGAGAAAPVLEASGTVPPLVACAAAAAEEATLVVAVVDVEARADVLADVERSSVAAEQPSSQFQFLAMCAHDSGRQELSVWRKLQ